jgi:hypothetical protein
MIATLFALAAAHAASTCVPPTVAALRARDQALLDAIAPGDKGLWDRTLAPGAVYVDENGTIMTRKAFLDDLRPLGANTSGHIAITDYQLRLAGGAALVIHKDDEREDFHGINLRAGYLMTETWLCQGGAWKLAMIHAYVTPADPPPIAVAEADLDPYAGRYAAAPDLLWEIRRTGDHLTGQRPDGPPNLLQFEARDVAFIPGRPRERRLFQRDAAGRITGFIDRREGEDILWKRRP